MRKFNPKKKFEVKVDNYTGPICISQLDDMPGNVRGIYYLMDEDQKILYIGKSKTSIRSRLYTHLSKEDPHPNSKRQTEITLAKREHYKYFGYSRIAPYFIEQAEVALIKHYAPDFNEQYLSRNRNRKTRYTITISEEEQAFMRNIYLNL